MTQEEQKQLLLVDLCTRLPYGVLLNCCNLVGEKLYTIDSNGLVNNDYDLEEVKPYLFPLSSMTNEQLYELREMFGFEVEFSNGFIELSTFHHGRLGYLEMAALLDWLNKNHFDYRGLIPLGLAINCTNLNIY